MNISHHFTLEELTASQTATRLGFKEQFEPSNVVVNNLTTLCRTLEKVREIWGGPLHISSGYRCPRLNKAIGGSATSSHMEGEAADIDLGSREKNQQLYQKILDVGIEFDQLINEYNFSWVHISFRYKNRRQILKIV